MSTCSIWMLVAGVALGILASMAFYFEYRQWNHGVCRKNGMNWRQFDTDSQGGRGYRAGDEICWISWPGIDGR